MVETNFTPIDDNAILKEVWDIKDVEAKTELADPQIQNISKLMTLAFIFDNELLYNHLRGFMVLQKSRNRQSMKEFVDVVKKKYTDENDGFSPFRKLMG